MTSSILWILIALQLAMGLFDIVYHHEMTERLAWRFSQRRELILHGARNLIYAVLLRLCPRRRRNAHGWRRNSGCPGRSALRPRQRFGVDSWIAAGMIGLSLRKLG
jgi:hypothetical protein